MKPRYFNSPAAFRAWLETHHATAAELLVGFHKTATGKASMTWSESVDQALCFGWIDGVRRRVDESRYTIRFTPRRPTSIWSNINVAKVAALRKAGLMTPAGEKAFAARDEKRSGIYAFERAKPAELSPVFVKQFKAQKDAWTWYQGQAPWYRRVTTHWVMSAKKDETRRRRLAILIEDSGNGRKIRGMPAAKQQQG